MDTKDGRTIQSTLFDTIYKIPTSVIVCNAEGPLPNEKI